MTPSDADAGTAARRRRRRKARSDTEAPEVDGDMVAALDAFIARRTREGGAAPVS